MYRAIVFIGMALSLASLAPVAVAQSQPIGSSHDLQGLQERSVQKPDSDTAVNSPYGFVDAPQRDGETTLQIDRNVQLQIRPERGNSEVGVYPTDNTSAGNQVQVRYQIEQ